MKNLKTKNIEIKVVSKSKCQINLIGKNLFIVENMVKNKQKWGIHPINSDHFINAEWICTFRNVLDMSWKVVKVSDEEAKYINERLLSGHDDIFSQETFYAPNVWYGYSNLTCNNKRYNFKIKDDNGKII